MKSLSYNRGFWYPLLVHGTNVARLGLQVGYIPGENGRDPGVQGQNSKTKSRGLPIGKPDVSYLSVPSEVIVWILIVLLWYLIS